MGFSVVTVVAAVCLANHLPVGASEAYGQRDAPWSEVTEVLTPSRVATEARKPFASSDGTLNASQLADTQGDDTNPSTWNATTPASLGIVPAAPEQLVFKGDGEQENVTTPPDGVITTPLEDGFTASREHILTTTQENVVAMHEGDGFLQMNPILEDGRVPTRPLHLVICDCPIPTPDGCRRFLSDLYIDGKDYRYIDIKKPLADLSVVVHNVTCEKEDHRFMNFSEGQFFLRDRGDLVLRKADHLNGLRVNDYCADPHQDKNGDIKWTLNVCVPPPSVPRCCPLGQALRDGKCEAANVPAILQPPMSAGVQEPSIYWPVIKNHYNPVTCASNSLTAIPLVPEVSYLLAVPTGLLHIWYPSDGHITRKYTYPPDLCVDGYVEASGSVRYTANICYTHPEELHRRVCEGNTCVRKCCQDDEEMSLLLYRCIPSNATTYTPLFTTPPDDYKIVNGFPLCRDQTLINESTVDSRGHFHLHGEALTAKEYCVDKFNNGLGEVSDMAKVCIREPTGWTKARSIALPICQIISILFLTLTVGCNCMVPELLQGGGWYQLFHGLSLMLGYASMLAQQMLSKNWSTVTCVAMGIVLQFGFLATFFWLNVMCFDVWRKIRSLNNYRVASTVPIWAYLLYAFGVPAAIGALTVCMQIFVPDGVPGVVKPNLAENSCFFSSPLSVFLYFYGPITFLFICNIAFVTHTFWTYKKFEKSSSVFKKNRSKNATTAKKATDQNHQKRDTLSDFKQHFFLLVLMSSCWITEVLSWLIKPLELWIVTDLLNSLQGFFIFVIFVANRAKRKHLKRKFPLPFKMVQRLREVVRQCCCQGEEVTCLTPVGSFTSHSSRKLSSSSIVSDLSTGSTSPEFSVSSISITLSDDQNVKKPFVFEPKCGVTTLSHSSLSTVTLQENDDRR